MQRPAGKLASEIGQQIRSGWRSVNALGIADDKERIISVARLRRWLKLAKSIDARMRLDGSPKNRRKKVSR